MLCWHWLPTNLVKGSNLPLLFNALHKRVFTKFVGLWDNCLMKISKPLFFGTGA